MLRTRRALWACILAFAAVSSAPLSRHAAAETGTPGAPATTVPRVREDVWTPPDVGELPDDAHGRLVRRGRDIFGATYAQIGPFVADPARRYAGNNLACKNCHLHNGTQPYALPVYGIAPDYPLYSARSGSLITLPDRLNACMRRSMNGRSLPAGSPELAALVAYVDFLSTGVPRAVNLKGYGAGDMPELDRAADPARGEPLYKARCLLCHGADGEGLRRSTAGVPLGYMVPPLWGEDSFNDGAGMNRLITAANFLHANMPHGVDYWNPGLAVEEAWDVAAFMLSRPRPTMPDLSKDFPDLVAKPVDTPYGPYADAFPERQHKYGPFAPIRAALRGLQEKGTELPRPQ